MKRTKYTVFVGRFQPFHNGHLEVCKKALSFSDQLIIVIGSYKSARTIKNPWTFDQRKQMIECALFEYSDRIKIINIRDFMYSNVQWVTTLQNMISTITDGSNDISLIGHRKDSSSFYLDFFPQWNLVEEPNYHGLNSSDVRDVLFCANENGEWKNNIPKEIADWISGWMAHSKSVYDYICNEYEYINKYKQQWSSAPYQPTFVTTDAVVVMNGHVLVVKRKVNPGKGLYALPGGFLGADETIEQSMLRELKEETKIMVPKELIMSSVKEQKVFDHPYRSLRGRTITHAFLIHFTNNSSLPQVKGSDDAEQALWMSFNDIYENEDNFFEDHIHIITYFLNKC